MSKPQKGTVSATGSIDYRALFHGLPTGYFIIDAEEPHLFLEANEAHFAMTGRSADIIGQPFFDVYPDVSEKFQKTKQSELHESIDRVVRTGKPETLETFRYDIPDGKNGFLVKFWKPTHYPLLDTNGKVAAVLQTSQDVTEETMTEKELEYRQWQLQETLSTGMIGTWQWDTETDIVVTDKNLAYAFGIDTKLATAGISIETFTNAIHPDDRDRIVAAINKAVKKRGLFTEEYRTIDADGEVRWLMARGKVDEDPTGTVMFPGVLVDITDRKHAEELVGYQALIAESIDDAVISFNKQGTITAWNHGAEVMFGYTEKEALGADSEMLLDLDPKYNRANIRKRAYSGKAWRGNLRYRRKDGNVIEVMASVSALRDSGGNTIGLVVIMQDLTKLVEARSKAEVERTKARAMRAQARLLKKQNDELMTLNRTKDEFIALTSHQLRTPATGTKQYLGMLLEGYAEPLGPRQRSFVQSAYDCNERQLRVVDDILRVAQVDLDKVVLRPELTDVGLFLRQIADEQSSKFARRDHRLEYTPPSELLEAEIDRDRLRMALDNIIDNADKYTEPGKRISMRLHKRAKQLYIEIEDEGVGINKADFSKLFQKFSRIDNPLSVEVGGSGLGLYWSKRIILMHGGDVRVKSRLGHGTTFTITLPLTRIASKEEPIPPMPRGKAAAKPVPAE